MEFPSLKKFRLAVACVLAVGLGLAWQGAEAFDLASQVREFTLPNGMRWLVVRRPAAPVFSGIVMVRVGGADEAPGKTGLAHMFEHMAFKGSSRIGTRDWAREAPVLQEMEQVGDELTRIANEGTKDAARIAELAQRMKELQRKADRYQAKNEVWEVLMRNGARGINAYTSKDHTAYYASMPKSRLALWARVMAEMIFDPAYREFYTERSVIAEERRTSVENNPEGAMAEKILSTSFANGPYSWSLIGFAKDIDGLTIADARAFHDRFYVPANMVGVVVGDVRVDEVKRAVAQAFGGFPSRPRPEGATSSGEPRAGVSTTLRFDAAPSLAVAFHKPTLPGKEEYTFDVIESLLCDGRASRLEKRLIYDRRIAKGVYCTDGYPATRLPNLFVIWVEPLKGQPAKKVLAAIEEELTRLRDEPAGEEELARARKQVTASIVYGLDSNDDLAEALARFQTNFGDWRILAEYPSQISKVDAAAVEAVARRYLGNPERIVVERERGAR